MSVIFSFISSLYLKQKTNILWCFSNLKFENILFSNNRYIFRSGRKVYTAKTDQIKYFAQNYLVKITFLFVQTSSWLCHYCRKLRSFKSAESFKWLFHYRENCMLLICIIRLWTTTRSDRIHPLNIRKLEP